MNKLQEQLKKKLAEKGMSVNALEKAAHLKPGAVQNIMRGRSQNPGLELLSAVSQVLNCTIEELTGRETPSPSPTTSTKTTYTTEPNQFWQADLYLAVLQSLVTRLETEQLKLSEEGADYYMKEVYGYCRQTGALDMHFADWTFQKMKERYAIS